MPRVPEKAKTGFWVAIGVFAAMLVWNYVEKRLP